MTNSTCTVPLRHDVLLDGPPRGTGHPQVDIVYSKDGWLVFFGFNEPEHPAIVFVNPFLPSTTAAAVIKWRMPEKCSLSTVVSMSASPTDPACILLLINTHNYGLEIITSSEGGMNWEVDFFRCVDFLYKTSPVFHGGKFYFLLSSIALGVYDPRQRAWDEQYQEITASTYNTLVESNGELLFRASASSKLLANPLVYKLNERKRWEELTELRGRALFLNERFATSAVAEVDGMKDRIFYSKFHGSAVKVDCELHRSAGGDLRLVPRPHVGLARLALARRAEGKSVGMSLPYSLESHVEGWHKKLRNQPRRGTPTHQSIKFD